MDDKWSAWLDSRNVVDKYKNLSNEDIKLDLQKNKLPCAVLLQNIEGDFNMGNIIRTANNFNLNNIYYFGKKKYDKRSAVGVFNYSPVIYLSSLEEVQSLKEKYVFIGFDCNIQNTIPIKNFKYPKNSLFIFGEENLGISDDTIKLLDYLVEIPSLGSVRSLNVASAAAIVMYDYWSKII